MQIKICKTKKEVSLYACQEAARIIKKNIQLKGWTKVVFATGKSQLLFLKCLAKDSSIDWQKVEIFQLDEFIGLSENNKSSFRRFLQENFIDKVNLGKANLINGKTDHLKAELSRLNRLLFNQKIDLTFLGIGENGHIAFNDPPADVKTTQPYLVVTLDNRNKTQQVKEGLFPRTSAVPSQAISMSVHQIMKSKKILCLAFGKRKAKAVKENFQQKSGPHYPASALRKHNQALIVLDEGAAALLQ